MITVRSNGRSGFSLNWLTVGVPLALIALLVTYRALPPKNVRLIVAAQTGHVDVVERLLQQGISPDAVSGTNSPLVIAIRHRQHAIVRVLLDHGANANFGAGSGVTPLSWAVRTDDSDLVEALVHAGANPELPNADGKSARDEAKSAPEILKLFTGGR
jgi:ankyrin repeat protein